MGKFTKILEEQYKEENEENELSKLDFISDYVFDFYTYDTEISETMAKQMLDVLESILNEKTFEYILKKENYVNYINMINTPFLIKKIEYGTSIRGAWLDDFKEYEISGIEIKENEIKIFIKDLIEFIKK